MAWFRIRGGTAGPHRKALDEALRGVRLAGSDLITAEMARSAAELVDSARRAQDPRLWLSATQRLDRLVARLPLPRSAVPGEPGDGAGGADDGADPLADVLGSGPTLGDSTEP